MTIEPNRISKNTNTCLGTLGYLLKSIPNSFIKEKNNNPVTSIFIITLYPPKNSEGADKYPIIANDRIPLTP
jgi:hypothetical protein